MKFLFLKKDINATFLIAISASRRRNGQAPKDLTPPSAACARRRTRPPSSAPPRVGGASASDRGAADDRALGGAYRARRGVDGPARAADHCGNAPQPRSRSAGRLRPVADRAASTAITASRGCGFSPRPERRRSVSRRRRAQRCRRIPSARRQRRNFPCRKGLKTQQMRKFTPLPTRPSAAELQRRLAPPRTPRDLHSGGLPPALGVDGRRPTKALADPRAQRI
jgi:hypothetical protein